MLVTTNLKNNSTILSKNVSPLVFYPVYTLHLSPFCLFHLLYRLHLHSRRPKRSRPADVLSTRSFPTLSDAPFPSPRPLTRGGNGTRTSTRPEPGTDLLDASLSQGFPV